MIPLKMNAAGRAALILTLVALPLVAFADKGPAPAPLPSDTDPGVLGATKARATTLVGAGVKSVETLYGDLSAEDDTHGASGAFFDPYAISAEAGSQLRITMTSEDIDSYLELYRQTGDTFEMLASDDDGAGGHDALLTYTTPAAGEYYLVARSYGAGATGSYTVALDIEPPLTDGGTDATPDRLLSMGETIQGTIDASDVVDGEGKSYELFSFHGTEGEYLDLYLESPDFDTVLTLYTGSLTQPDVYASNDDIELGANTNSRLSGTLPETTTYNIQVKAYSGTGSFSLTASSTPAGESAPVEHDWAELYPGGGDPAGRYALLVGIDDYPGTANDLTSCRADTRVIHDLLVRRFGFDEANIVTLNDAEANREHILNAFTRHLGQAGPDGVAVFYYSGHGAQLDGNYGLAAEFDAEEDGVDESIAVWALDENNTFILDDELGMLADGLAADRVLVMLDSCHSGTGTRARGEKQIRNFADVKGTFTIPDSFVGVDKNGAPTGAYVAGGDDFKELVMRRQNHVLLAAAAPDETALCGSDWPDYGGVASVFTYHVAKALDEAGDGDTFADIGAKVREEAMAYTIATQDHVQTAQYEGDLLDMPVGRFLEPR